MVSFFSMLSVILPVRDGARTLDSAIASLHAQTRRPNRVWLVDDGSTDSTPELLESWKARWSAIRAIRIPPKGIARALNTGLSACLAEEGSEWVARMDADDLCDPRRFEMQLGYAARDSRLALIGTEVIHGGATEQQGGMKRHIDWANALHSHEELELGLWVDSPLPHPSWMVRRDAFEAIGRYDESGTIPEDYDWLHRYFAAAPAFGFRAGKPEGAKLLDWNESDGRLTRTSGAYSAGAFDAVKVRALAERLRERSEEAELYLLGLGPKAKSLLPRFLEAKLPIRAIVDVHPRRVGIRYSGVEVWGIEDWKRAMSPERALALIGVGTPEAREECFRLCRNQGLKPLTGFLGL